MKTLFLCSLILLSTISSQAQLELGVRMGVSSIDLADNLSVTSLTDQSATTISPADATYGVHFGVYSRLSIAGFYVEPALLFNSASTTYRVSEAGESGVLESLRAETYRKVDVPLLVGVHISAFRFYGGPVARFHLDSASELLSIDGYQQNFETSSYSFRVGTGLDLWRLRFDLGYEGSLSRFGDHITIGGEQYAFNDYPGRLLGSVGVKF